MLAIVVFFIVVSVGGFLVYSVESGKGKEENPEILGKYTQAGYVANGCLQKRPPRR